MVRVRVRVRANTKRRKTQEEGGDTSNSSSQREREGEREMGGGDQTSDLLPPQKEIIGVGETSNRKSKREMGGEETSNPLPPQKEIRVTINPSILECSICFDPLCSPLHQCMNGHVMCPTCWPKVQYKCPTCDVPVGSRNNALETVLESIHLPCTYTYLGCCKSVSYSQMQLHTETCEFGSSLCSIPGYAHKAFSGDTSNLLLPQNETGEIRGGEISNPLPPQNDNGQREETLVTINSVLLECSICFKPLCTPLYQCMDGHVACPSCWSKIQYKCPSCYAPIGARNIALENVLESLHVPCTYAYLGCCKSDFYSKMQVHTDMCEFRPSLCPIPGCAHNAFSGEWPGHFLEDHKFPCNQFIYGETWTIVFNQGCHYFTLFGPDKNMFLLVNEPVTNMGNALSLYCFDVPHLCQNVLSYELMVGTDSGMVHLKSKVHSIKEWKRGEGCGSFLLVPLGISLSEEMKVHVLINRKLDVISID